MAETRNAALAAWMAEHEMGADALVDAVNDAIRGFAGRPGNTSERTVFRWLSGENQWPQALQRRALEEVTGRTAVALGFVPRGKRTTAAPLPEDPQVQRRRFCGAATAAVAAPMISSRPPRVGTSDVIRLRDSVDTLARLDAERGGHGALARAALAGAAEALDLQKRSATQRVRHRLFALAADFAASAAWSMIDAGQLAEAGRHLDRALTLAGMSQEPETTMQIWNLRSMLARQQRDYAVAVAAAQAAQATAAARRSPLHASLAHARTAVGQAHGGDARAAVRSLRLAEDALGRADLTGPRPTWISFYGPAELHSLTAIIRDVVGEPEEAEAAAYKALKALPASYRRNRAHTTARLALAQLHQGDVEQACRTSGDVFAIMAGDPLPGRMRSLLGDFHRDLITLAPSSHVVDEWTDRYRTEWSPRDHGPR
ncbi:XRE family transcriptional regulator [Streptomyces sp. NPDC048604]|uniref:XRE family transcriptional regulator n=1 Tax=Streptomyces sp. NPDC048604 TaxID=3365578 RepID=UPI00371F93AC